MSFTSPSGNKNKGGGAWSCKLYFDYNADLAGTGDFYSDPELKTKLADYIGENEVITNIKYFKHPLNATQVTAALFHHAFVVFETAHWWWSIEKNDEGITIQRAKYLKNVRDKYRQEQRTSHWWDWTSTPSLVKETSGRKRTIQDVIDFLYNNDFLNKKYDWSKWHSNCQGFASAFYGNTSYMDTMI